MRCPEGQASILGCDEKKFPWGVQHNLATSLYQGSPPLPLTDQAAGGEMRDIGGLGLVLRRSGGR